MTDERLNFLGIAHTPYNPELAEKQRMELIEAVRDLKKKNKHLAETVLDGGLNKIMEQTTIDDLNQESIKMIRELQEENKKLRALVEHQ